MKFISFTYENKNSFGVVKEDTVIDLTQYYKKSSHSISRIKSRVIGQNGKARKVMEEISNTNFSELSIWFSALENDTKLFKIDEIEEKVKSGMPIIKETIESINKKP